MQAPMSEKFESGHDNRHDGRHNPQNGCKNRRNGRYNPQNGHGNLCNGSGDRHNSQRNIGGNYDKPLQIIGMAKKAGLLAVGNEDAQKAVRAGKAILIIFASDTSEGSIRRIRYEAERTQTLNISVPYTKFEFSRIAGRGSPGILAVLDLGLAEGFVRRLAAIDMTCYGEIAGLLRAEIKAQKSDNSYRGSQAGRGNRAGKARGESKEYNAGKGRKSENKVRRADNRRTKI